MGGEIDIPFIRHLARRSDANVVRLARGSAVWLACDGGAWVPCRQGFLSNKCFMAQDLLLYLKQVFYGTPFATCARPCVYAHAHARRRGCAYAHGRAHGCRRARTCVCERGRVGLGVCARRIVSSAKAREIRMLQPGVEPWNAILIRVCCVPTPVARSSFVGVK